MFIEANTKKLNDFIKDINTQKNTEQIVIKSEYDINDVNFEFVGLSRIDNQKIYRYKAFLPKFEYIDTNSGFVGSIQF